MVVAVELNPDLFFPGSTEQAIAFRRHVFGGQGTGEQRLRALFDGLAAGGTVRTRLERQFWGVILGAVTGKYGIGWQVNLGAGGPDTPSRWLSLVLGIQAGSVMP